MTVYHNQNPERAARIFTNPPGAFGYYDAIQLIATRRYSRGWEIQGSYTWSRARSNYDNDNPSTGQLFINGNWGNPNTALFSCCRTRADFTHAFKLFGTYMFPYWGGVRVSGIYQHVSGAPWARTAFFGPLAGSPKVEPIGAYELEARSNIDLRVEKTFPAGRQASFGVYLDVFNLTNRGIATGVTRLSGPNFGLPVAWSAPRTARAGVRLVF